MLNVTYLSVSGVRSAVHDSGPRDASEAVVFVHGNPGPMDDWETLVPSTSGFARAIAIDMPGFGRADHPRTFDFTLEGYARHLGGLLEQLGVRRAHLVLHDFGGGWGLRWAVDHPAALASLTLINTGFMPGYRWHKFARIWQTPVLGELFQLVASSSSIRRVMNANNPKPFPRQFTDRVTSYADWNQKRAVLDLYRSCKDVEASLGAIVAPASWSDLPVCVVWGERDPYLPASYAERQKEVFPRAQVRVLPGLGHWPFIDDPETVKACVLPFLQAQVGSARADAPAVAG
jgi:pimeloyl-ACP methyl ester carboxylesterase